MKRMKHLYKFYLTLLVSVAFASITAAQSPTSEMLQEIATSPSAERIQKDIEKAKAELQSAFASILPEKCSFEK